MRRQISRRMALKGALASTAGGLLGGCGGGGAEDAPGGDGISANSLLLLGPAGGNVGETVSGFSVELAPSDGSIDGLVVVTPSDGGAGGSFSPSTVTLGAATRSASFSYTAAKPGNWSITVTSDRGLKASQTRVYAASSATSPLIAVGFDPITPEQVSLHCPVQRTVPAGATVTVRYKPVTSALWRQGHPLLHVIPTYVTAGAPEPVIESFSGVLFDLLPGTTYDIRLTVTEPGQRPLVITTTRSTRALPPAAGRATVTARPGADLQAVFNALKPGDVLELQNGTYTVTNTNGLRPNVAGTPDKLIYIRGASRDGVVIHAPSSVALQLGATSHMVIENLTVRGTGFDGGGSAESFGILFNNGSGVQTDVTIRNVTITGVDRAIKAYARIDGCLVYQCMLSGNNTWDMAYTIDPSTGAANITWNDDGISLPGRGNAAWNNTLIGFGDAFSVYQEVMSAAVFFYRNRVEMTGDDAFEADEATRNIGFYDNYIANSATLLSLDPLYGGPLYCFRNVSVNTIRGPFKWNSPNSGQLVYNNTILRTEGTTGAGWAQANNGVQSNWSFRNNLFVYRGAAAITMHFNTAAELLDFTHNAWFPDRAFNWPAAGGNYASLAATSLLPERQTLFGTLQRMRSANPPLTASTIRC